MKEKIKNLHNFIKKNWFKLAILIIILWVGWHLVDYLKFHSYLDSAEKILRKYGI